MGADEADVTASNGAEAEAGASAGAEAEPGPGAEASGAAGAGPSAGAAGEVRDGAGTAVEVGAESDATTRVRARKPATARERARAEITEEILTCARAQLADRGADGLSLRAVARELGMSSSAIYRYFPSREELLTELIIRAYNSLGDAAESAYETHADGPPGATFRAVWRAVRRWALEHRHEYAVIYGSPVPGYRAPDATIGPASRLPNVLLRILADQATHPGDTRPAITLLPVWADPARAALLPLRSGLPGPLDNLPLDLTLAITSWATLLGANSLELWGHLHNVVDEDLTARAAFYDAQIELMIALLGLDT